MLPKVATHILHTTSRAAASIQHQTHTFRNVLQLQSSSGPSSSPGNLAPWNGSSSSNWGNNGAGPGGAKHNAGSRFHSGYTGTVRAVTQANAVASNDGTFNHSDETDEIPRHVAVLPSKRTRIRSRSLSIPVQGHGERGEKFGVLKTIQLHARSRHAFAPNVASSNSLGAGDAQGPVTSDGGPRPLLSRRNSTSAPFTSSDGLEHMTPSSNPPVYTRRNSTSTLSPTLADSQTSSTTPPAVTSLATDPATPQTVLSPALRDSDAYIQLRNALNSHDSATVAEAVWDFRQNTVNPTVLEFNMALSALVKTRRSGEPIQLILETYNDMLARSLLPNLRTYTELIFALCARDHEVQKSIHALELRLKNRHLDGLVQASNDESDRRRIEALQAEKNFSSAMSLFEAILAMNGNDRCPFNTYIELLRSAAYHGSLSSANNIFAQLEKRTDFHPSPKPYKYLIQAYSNVGEINGAEEVFNEYLRVSKDLAGTWATGGGDPTQPQRYQLLLWNQMIEAYFHAGLPDKAVGLVDQMINSTAGPDFGPSDIPPTAASTFTTVLSGFCQMGDVATALVWFDRLLQQTQETQHPFEVTGTATRPDHVAWSVMLDALAVHGMLHDLNRLFSVRLRQASHSQMMLRPFERALVHSANISRIHEMDPKRAADTLEFLAERVVPRNTSTESASMVQEISEAYLSIGMYEAAVIQLVKFVSSRTGESFEQEDDRALTPVFEQMQQMQLSFTRQLYERTQGNVPFVVVLQLARIADSIKVMQQAEYTPLFLHSYGLSRVARTLPFDEMTERDWELVLYAAVEVEAAAMDNVVLADEIPNYAFEGVLSLLQDFAEHNVALDRMHASLVRRTIQVLSSKNGKDDVEVIFTQLGPSFLKAFDTQQSAPALAAALTKPSSGSSQIAEQLQPDSTTSQRLAIDSYQTKFIEEVLQRNTSSRSAVLQAFGRFRDGIEKGKAPSPLTIGRLIQSLGRLGEMEGLSQAYTTAQSVLQLLESNKSWQTEAWFMIEDNMIIALAHHGDVDSAHVHRMRILEQGGAPTADAYGALILNVKDTTDDTSNAMALFQESQSRGVVPNQYLYNNIISKLAKARKADYALELFQQMKANRVHPSSITYGAVIGACARVGDVNSAELLFSEMTGARNFKPRVPPYNTMMQMYTTTKPNRERALHFYQELRKAGVVPTAHTYKLLMDAYGVIEPVDIHSMEQVFQSLQQDGNVEIQGNHFSTLINAYGCVQKDLDKAIEVFNSIPSYPRTQLDAVVFEAMINVLVAHRRTDLIPEYISKMNAAGVHMTAYIANFLIKGYAMVGDLEHARSIFESLVDPPEGMAAPNNHAPHETRTSPVIGHMEPVYREPSTWEAMIRAELGSGNRQEATELLERLKARQYPEAVYNRISGIMVDHSMVLS